MELLAIPRVLWERRIVVALGMVLAVAVGLIAGRHGGAAGGTALGSTRMILDTPDSQLVEAAPNGATKLPQRAALLADAVSTAAGTALVAHAAGVPVAQLAVLGPAATTSVPQVSTPLVTAITAGATAPRSPYVVDLLADNMTPIISVAAYAPDRSRAGRLAAAAAGVLRSLLVKDDGSRTHGFVLDTFAPVRTRQMPAASSHRRILMAAGALVVFVFWCACVAIATAATGRRHSGARLA